MLNTTHKEIPKQASLAEKYTIYIVALELWQLRAGLSQWQVLFGLAIVIIYSIYIYIYIDIDELWICANI